VDRIKMTRYSGSVLGFSYDIEKDTDEEFKLWLKQKLKVYALGENSQLVKEVLKELFQKIVK